MNRWHSWSWVLVAAAVVVIALPLVLLSSDKFLYEWIETDHPVDGAQWQLPGAWGFHAYDIINAVLLLVTLLYVIRSISVAEAALNKSHHAYVQSLTDTRYDAMDKLYFELLRERRQTTHPQGENDPYPLMVWNFIETIVDKCEKDPSGELMRTWAPLISAEACSFGDFMEKLDANGRPVNSAYFKNQFVLLARALVPASRQALKEGRDLDGVAFIRLFRALETIKEVASHEGATLARRNARQLWLKWKLNEIGFGGFARDEDFLHCFARIHSMSEAHTQAIDGWNVPEDIRHDDVRNNERAREEHLFGRYSGLMSWMLRNVPELCGNSGPQAPGRRHTLAPA